MKELKKVPINMENNEYKYNVDLPQEVIDRQIIRDLRKEIAELKWQLEKKEEAIKAFKKWQTRMVHYKWNYWFHEAKKLVDEIPDQEAFNATYKMLNGMEGYKTLRKRIENTRQCMLAAKEYMEQHKEE